MRKTPPENVIEKFGSSAKLSIALQISTQAIYMWTVRGSIPKARHKQIIEAARSKGIRIRKQDLV